MTETMGQSNTGAEALVDILNLCDRALSALQANPPLASQQANFDAARRHLRRLSAAHLTLVIGSRADDNSGSQAR
jgi:hypothetical protein